MGIDLGSSHPQSLAYGQAGRTDTLWGDAKIAQSITSIFISPMVLSNAESRHMHNTAMIRLPHVVDLCNIIGLTLKRLVLDIQPVHSTPGEAESVGLSRRETNVFLGMANLEELVASYDVLDYFHVPPPSLKRLAITIQDIHDLAMSFCFCLSTLQTLILLRPLELSAADINSLFTSYKGQSLDIVLVDVNSNHRTPEHTRDWTDGDTSVRSGSRSDVVLNLCHYYVDFLPTCQHWERPPQALRQEDHHSRSPQREEHRPHALQREGHQQRSHQTDIRVPRREQDHSKSNPGEEVPSSSIFDDNGIADSDLAGLDASGSNHDDIGDDNIEDEQLIDAEGDNEEVLPPRRSARHSMKRPTVYYEQQVEFGGVQGESDDEFLPQPQNDDAHDMNMSHSPTPTPTRSLSPPADEQVNEVAKAQSTPRLTAAQALRRRLDRLQIACPFQIGNLIEIMIDNIQVTCNVVTGAILSVSLANLIVGSPKKAKHGQAAKDVKQLQELGYKVRLNGAYCYFLRFSDARPWAKRRGVEEVIDRMERLMDPNSPERKIMLKGRCICKKPIIMDESGRRHCEQKVNVGRKQYPKAPKSALIRWKCGTVICSGDDADIEKHVCQQ
ncbi:hypothetical protein OPT61_g5835 [Boeremia exigua]|uniref:Uncharacterized protein n=1 Tax=Boeremia exigua TaxID=749465 RepID=A0ACC2I8X9_9PLEO|nr:hypothetical protein OPT61_g5835 [Boeremia exigua]